MHNFVCPYKVPTTNWLIEDTKISEGAYIYNRPRVFNFSFSMRLYQCNMAMRRRLQLFCRNIVSLILPVDSKGALLVLLWSTMMFVYQFFIISYAANDSSPRVDNVSYALFYMMLPTCVILVFGLVADMCWKIQDHCRQHILCLHWMDYSMCFILCNT